MERLPMVRCYSCGKVVPHFRYEYLLSKGLSNEEAFRALGLKRYCCMNSVANTPVHATREVYANQELTKNLRLPPPREESISSLPPY